MNPETPGRDAVPSLTFLDFQRIAAGTPTTPQPLPHWPMARPAPVAPRPAKPGTEAYEPRQLNSARSVRAPRTPGKADPIWDTAFMPKWNKTPIEDTLPTPKGYTEPFGLKRYLDRIEELDDLARTQPYDLPPLSVQLQNAAAIDINDELNAAETSDCVAYLPDPATIINTNRRIEWERSVWLSSKVTKVRLVLTDDGKTGIAEVGARRQDPALLTSCLKRFRETGVTDRSIETIMADRLRVAYHDNRPVLAACWPDDLIAARTRSGDYLAYVCGYGDDDPTRDAFVTADLMDRFSMPSAPASMADLGFDDPDSPSPAVMYEEPDGSVTFG